MSRAVLTWLAVLLFAAGGLALWYGWRHWQSAAIENFGSESEGTPTPAKLTEFTLIERSGKPFRSAEMRGKVWVVSFFFASCPGVCLKQNANVAELEKVFGPRGVTFVSITVDPENDTPSVLTEYAHRFRADQNAWLFLTGERSYIDRIGKEMFQVPIDKVAHSERLIVIDRTGKIRGSYISTREDELDELRQHLGRLLAEPLPDDNPAPAAPATP